MKKVLVLLAVLLVLGAAMGWYHWRRDPGPAAGHVRLQYVPFFTPDQTKLGQHLNWSTAGFEIFGPPEKVNVRYQVLEWDGQKFRLLNSAGANGLDRELSPTQVSLSVQPVMEPGDASQTNAMLVRFISGRGVTSTSTERVFPPVWSEPGRGSQIINAAGDLSADVPVGTPVLLWAKTWHGPERASRGVGFVEAQAEMLERIHDSDYAIVLQAMATQSTDSLRIPFPPTTQPAGVVAALP